MFVVGDVLLVWAQALDLEMMAVPHYSPRPTSSVREQDPQPTLFPGPSPLPCYRVVWPGLRGLSQPRPSGVSTEATGSMKQSSPKPSSCHFLSPDSSEATWSRCPHCATTWTPKALMRPCGGAI